MCHTHAFQVNSTRSLDVGFRPYDLDVLAKSFPEIYVTDDMTFCSCVWHPLHCDHFVLHLDGQLGEVSFNCVNPSNEGYAKDLFAIIFGLFPATGSDVTKRSTIVTPAFLESTCCWGVRSTAAFGFFRGQTLMKWIEICMEQSQYQGPSFPPGFTPWVLWCYALPCKTLLSGPILRGGEKSVTGCERVTTRQVNNTHH